MGGAFVMVIGSTGDFSFLIVLGNHLIVWKKTGLVVFLIFSWCKYVAYRFTL